MTNEPPLPCKSHNPAPELRAVLESLAPGRALDLAAGLGRHAYWLAARGWEVIAVDINAPKVATNKDAADKVIWVEADLEKVWIPFLGDLVVCWLYWQWDLLPAIAGAVRPGGVVALAGKTSGRFATSLRAYRDAFPGWQESATGEDPVKAWFIARKPE